MADYTPLTEEELQRELQSLPGWEVQDGWLRKTYGTPGWPHTMLLVQTIAFVAEAAWHHPDLRVGYARVTVMLQTHRSRAITRCDTELARRIDEVVLWKPLADSALPGFPKNWVHPVS